MTLTANRDVEDVIGDPRERRGKALTPRRSWASPQPFEPRRTEANATAAAPGYVRWEQAAMRYMLTAVLADVTVGVTVAAIVLATVIGLGTSTLVGAVLTGVGYVIVVALLRGYELRALGAGPAEFQSLIQAGFVLAGVMMAIAYTSQLAVPRRLVFIAVPVIVVLTSIERYAQRRTLHRRRSEGTAMMRTLLVGDAAHLRRLVRDLAATPSHGYHVIGVCVPSLDARSRTLDRQLPVLGAVADVPQVVSDHAADVVIVAGSAVSGDALRRLSWALGRANAELIVAPDLIEVTGPRLSLRPTANLSLLRVEVTSSRWRTFLKSALDRTLGVLLCLVALPVVGAAALAVRATSPGPAFFRQTRVGVDGREFVMWKLRSMYIDADARRDALLASSDRDGPMFKMHSDPRITPVGRFLRRFSIDELPQLFNVMLGDMSLVGPRPPLVDEVATYEDSVHRRLHVRPGLTGLWQVSGRADLSWEESVRLDLRYVDNWSVAMDLMILWKTGRAVLKGSGAY